MVIPRSASAKAIGGGRTVPVDAGGQELREDEQACLDALIRAVDSTLVMDVFETVC